MGQEAGVHTQATAQAPTRRWKGTGTVTGALQGRRHRTRIRNLGQRTAPYSSTAGSGQGASSWSPRRRQQWDQVLKSSGSTWWVSLLPLVQQCTRSGGRPPRWLLLGAAGEGAVPVHQGKNTLAVAPQQTLKVLRGPNVQKYGLVSLFQLCSFTISLFFSSSGQPGLLPLLRTL